MRILFMTLDKFPPFRPAARALFGDDLPRRGHRVDWLIQANEPGTRAGPQPFRGGVAYVAPTTAGDTRLARLRKYWLDFRNDLDVFNLLARGRYTLVQVKDR